MHHNAIDLTGQRFGRLAVSEPMEKRSGGFVVWKCICDCGKECFVSSGNLKNGSTRSCGCFRKDIHSTHSMSRTKEYTIWVDMIQRCENPNIVCYKNYGGRGIQVCSRWRNSFEAFYVDMGPCPKGKTLDRIDNYGNYELGNCKYSTHLEQNQNRRSNSCGKNKQRWFFAYNEKLGIWAEEDSQWGFARKYRLCQSRISSCLNGKRKQHKGWIFEFLI